MGALSRNRDNGLNPTPSRPSFQTFLVVCYRAVTKSESHSKPSIVSDKLVKILTNFHRASESHSKPSIVSDGPPPESQWIQDAARGVARKSAGRKVISLNALQTAPESPPRHAADSGGLGYSQRAMGQRFTTAAMALGGGQPFIGYGSTVPAVPATPAPVRATAGERRP